MSLLLCYGGFAGAVELDNVIEMDCRELMDVENYQKTMKPVPDIPAGPDV